MKATNIVAIILIALLSSCQDDGLERRFANWFYYIETKDDATNCQIDHLTKFKISKHGISSGETENVDKYSNHGKPYGDIFFALQQVCQL